MIFNQLVKLNIDERVYYSGREMCTFAAPLNIGDARPEYQHAIDANFQKKTIYFH